MWKFKTPNFVVKWEVTDCQDLDLSWDDTGEVEENLESGLYTAFDSCIQVTYLGKVIGESYLGQSIYENVEDFRDHFGLANTKYSSYFSDMVREAIQEARNTFNNMKPAPVLRKELKSNKA